MTAVGGSIESVTLDGRNFPATADAAAERKLGGFENESQANGDGTARLIKTRVPWSLDGLTLRNPSNVSKAGIGTDTISGIPLHTPNSPPLLESRVRSTGVDLLR